MTPSEGGKAWSARALRDLALIEAALQGQGKAYEELLERYEKPLYHTVLKLVRQPADAEDLTSEIFTKAFRHLARYRPEFAFSTWLFRIGTNHCIDFLRRKRVKTVSFHQAGAAGEGEELAWDFAAPAPTPHEALIRQQRRQMAQQVVTLLPPRYARLVRLRYFQELSYEEVAQELQAPLGTVKAQLHRARELMAELLGNRQADL